VKRRYVVFLALIAYFFVIGFFQYPGFNSGAYAVGFVFGIGFGLVAGILLMWRLWFKFIEDMGWRFDYVGWRASLMYYGPKVMKISTILISFGVGFFLVMLVIQASAVFGSSLLIPTYFGIAVLLLNLAIGLTRDTPDYSGRFDEIITQLDKIRRRLKKSRVRRC
jgi:hypothetical protein